MTRKDYEAIARAIKQTKGRYPSEVDPLDRMARLTARWMANNIADVMARDNPRFDRGRFLKACGVAS